MIDIDKTVLPSDDNVPFTVAISGGVDSVVGLHLLHRIYGKRVHACHFNHKLRNRNDVMQKAVEWFCEEREIPLTIGTREGKLEQENESFLRECRLQFYKSIGGVIVTAHHLNDAVESYMMNFLRGCPEHTPIPRMTYFDNYTIVKPFLRSPKKCFEEYAENNFLDEYVVEDETNADSGYGRRNWIRNEILENFEQFGLCKIVLKKFYM